MPPAKQKPSKRRAISPHDSIDSGSTCKPIPVRDGEQPRRAQRRRLSTVASISSAGVRPRVDVDLHLDALETRTPDLFKGSCFVLEEDIWDPGAMSQVKRNIEACGGSTTNKPVANALLLIPSEGQGGVLSGDAGARLGHGLGLSAQRYIGLERVSTRWVDQCIRSGVIHDRDPWRFREDTHGFSVDPAHPIYDSVDPSDYGNRIRIIEVLHEMDKYFSHPAARKNHFYEEQTKRDELKSHPLGPPKRKARAFIKTFMPVFEDCCYLFRQNAKPKARGPRTGDRSRGKSTTAVLGTSDGSLDLGRATGTEEIPKIEDIGEIGDIGDVIVVGGDEKMKAPGRIGSRGDGSDTESAAKILLALGHDNDDPAVAHSESAASTGLLTPPLRQTFPESHGREVDVAGFDHHIPPAGFASTEPLLMSLSSTPLFDHCDYSSGTDTGLGHAGLKSHATTGWNPSSNHSPVLEETSLNVDELVHPDDSLQPLSPSLTAGLVDGGSILSVVLADTTSIEGTAQPSKAEVFERLSQWSKSPETCPDSLRSRPPSIIKTLLATEPGSIPPLPQIPRLVDLFGCYHEKRLHLRDTPRPCYLHAGFFEALLANLDTHEDTEFKVAMRKSLLVQETLPDHLSILVTLQREMGAWCILVIHMPKQERFLFRFHDGGEVEEINHAFRHWSEYILVQTIKGNGIEYTGGRHYLRNYTVEPASDGASDWTSQVLQVITLIQRVFESPDSSEIWLSTSEVTSFDKGWSSREQLSRQLYEIGSSTHTPT